MSAGCSNNVFEVQKLQEQNDRGEGLTAARHVQRALRVCTLLLRLLSLGARMHLSRVYMVITLLFFKHFAQQETPGYMLSFFEKKTPL